MPIFRYEGYRQDGTEINGTIEADGHKDAALKIKETGVFPKEITEAVFTKKKILRWKRLPAQLPDITRMLSTLLSSGVPLIGAVGAIATEQKGHWRGILIDIKDQLSAGATLARAAQAYPYIFPEFYTSMVAAGENSGRLPEVLSKLSDFLESQSSIKNKVQTALVYPLFMTFVSIIILSFLFTFVVPKIVTMFEDTSASLPFVTIILIWISSAFQKFWWLMLLFAAGGVFFYYWLRKTRKEIIDSFLLKLPFGVTQSLYTARFSMTMSFLLSGGVKILDALNLTSKATGNAVLENRIMSARNVISQGGKLSNCLEGFPPTFLQFISTGENTGQLPEVLLRAANSYEADFDKKLMRLISLLEPALILFMALVVGFIVIAVLLPIFELNQLIK